MARNEANPEISDKRMNELAFQIVELLDGVPLSQALHVLDEAKAVMLDCHVVDTSRSRFTGKRAAFKEFFSGCE